MLSGSVGASDLVVSRVGLGCNNFGPMPWGENLGLEEARPVVEAALAAGITLFDTSDSYGAGESERILGRLLRRRRDEVVIATKFGSRPLDGGPAPGSRASMRAALESSLRRLRTDRVDLWYYHRPDGVTPVAETAGSMAELVLEGKARFVGCANVDATQAAEAHASAEALAPGRFVAVQNQYSLLERDADDDVLPLCRELGMGFVPSFPLACGLLTGKYGRGRPLVAGSRLAAFAVAEPLRHAAARLLSDDVFDRLEELTAFARERGRTLLDLAVAGVASQPGVASVIAGATTGAQVRANASAGEWKLTADELARLPRVTGLGVHP